MKSVITFMEDNTTYIYGFSGIFNHCLYIGSTSNLERREKEHRSALEWSNHFNPFLQAAHDAFGADNFIMIVLATADNAEERQRKERHWIVKKAKDDALTICNRSLHGGNTKSGYTLSDKTKQRQSEARKGVSRPIEKTRAQQYVFLDPTGKRVECYGLKALCAKHNLNIGHLSRVWRGKLKQHKGWRRL